jgi:hypothetical protein
MYTRFWASAEGLQCGPSPGRCSAAAVAMLAIPAIAGLTVDWRFLSSRRAPYWARPWIIMHTYATAMDAVCRAAISAGLPWLSWMRRVAEPPLVRLRRRAVGPQYNTCSVFIADLAADLQ